MYPCEYYSVNEIQEIIGCGRQKAYKIVNCKGFPKTRIGRSFYIDKKEFDKWRARNMYSEIYI